MGPAESILEITDIIKEYIITKGFGNYKKQVLKALNSVTLTLPTKTTLGCVGESGCGKSTLAKIITLLEKPTSGTVKFRGKDINSFNRKEKKQYRKEVQLVLQDPYSSLPENMNIDTVLNEPFLIHGIGTRVTRREKIKELLAYVKLNENIRYNYPNQLSGGQRQRVNIARALALTPSLIVCDEPVSSLDVSIQNQILNLLKELQSTLNVNYFFISHDLRVVHYICERVAVMYLGRIVEHGSSEDIFQHPLHPYTQALLPSIPLLKNKKEHLSRLKGEVPSPIDTPHGCAFHPRCNFTKDICREEVPPLIEVKNSHWVACHFVRR